MSTALEKFEYDDKIVRSFAWATVVWGLVGMLVGVIIAFQLFIPALNFGLPWTSFGRLRPLHTNAVIFAFCGNAIFAGVYYSTQRLLKTRMGSDILSRLHFIGWQLIIVSAAVTLPLGITTSKEYAELEWPIDIAIALVWVVFAANFFLTVWKRREKVLYVSIWFYIGTIVAITMLHIVNSLAIPATLLKSYPVYTGVQDALVQWWYGHNAVAFFLTTPFLGLAYYFIPKAVGKPIYSYRLSIIHFWSLIFVYIWAGPHHLIYSSIPEWLQSLGMVFSLMLLAPSWGGAINFVLTLRNGWEQVRTDAIVKFMAAAVTFYMMATFEGPLLSIKSVNKISHNTDWTIGHVHSGALGWNGFLIFAMLYWLIPRLYKTELFSRKLANIHFWCALFGIVIYVISMWISGVTQGVMSLKLDDSGVLVHSNFLEIMAAVIPLHAARAVGGGLYLAGFVMMIYNLLKTVAGKSVVNVQSEGESRDRASHARDQIIGMQNASENSGALMGILSFAAVAVGTIFEIAPLISASKHSIEIASVTPYTPLEIEGRDLYIREGCNNCHTQQIRPLVAETKRYGDFSKAGEFSYDTPHLWGSKRTGPDLQRIGQKYGHSWHWKHMIDPRTVSPGSVMPKYPWLATNTLALDDIRSRLHALSKIGIPYSEKQIFSAESTARAQAKKIADELKEQGENPDPDSELIALIAYLQRLGTDLKKTEQVK